MANELIISSIDDINTDDLTQTVETLRTLWESSDSDVDTNFGVANSLILQPSALLAQCILDNINKWNTSTNLSLLSESDADEADDELLERMMANFNLSREEGTYATGLLKITTERPIELIFPNNYIFTTTNGLKFYTTMSYNAVYDSNTIIRESIRVIEKLSDTSYIFSIPVTATEVGAKYNIEKGTILNTSSKIPSVTNIEAYNTFTGGVNKTSNSELLAKASNSTVAPLLNGKVNMQAALLQSSWNINDSSVIGIGQKEMIRDSHSVFPISYGGRADWYIRTNYAPITETITKTCKCVKVAENSNDYVIWEIKFNKEDYTGLYTAYNFKNNNLSSTLQQSDDVNFAYEIRDYDLTPFENETAPDVVKASEAAFSAYQTLTYHVKEYDQTSITLNEEKTIICDIRYMPNIDTLQTWASSPEQSIISGDILIKAPYICQTTISFSIRCDDILAESKIQETRQAVIDKINSYAFKSSLPKSVLISCIQQLLGPSCYITDFNMIGSILAITDNETKTQTITLTSKDALTVPNLEQFSQLSPNTTCFYTDTNHILITY